MGSAEARKIGLIGASAIVAGNMMGSGIAMLPANLAAIGSIAVVGWIFAGLGALALAWVYARLGTEDPQEGGPIAYAGQVAPILGYQTGVLYFHANWIGNLAIAITGVDYLSVFVPALTRPVPAGLACITLIWVFTGLNLLGARWIGRLATVGVALLLVPVVLTGTYGWLFFDAGQFAANWNVGGVSGSSAVMAAVLLCVWSFIGVESASVNAGVVEDPRRNVPRATLIGVSLAGIVYMLSCTAISGMFPAGEMAASGAPFATAAGRMLGAWAPGLVSAVTAFACLASLGSWMMLVSQAGARAAKDGTLPSVFAKTDRRGIPVGGLLLSGAFMTGLMVLLMAVSGGGSTQVLFGHIASIAVLLTLPAYFYSALNLLRLHGFRNRKALVQTGASVVASAFCFTALAGAERTYLAAATIAMLAVFIFYCGKDRAQKG